MNPQKKRNFILLGHAQSGKTTLSEGLLYFCKATTRRGTTADGTTVSDYSFDEIERKSSINSSLLYCDYKDTRIQIIDAPGYADFLGEVISGLRAVDGAVIVVDATAGVEVGTERAWQLAEEAGLACVIFISKADKEGADLSKALSDVQNALSKRALMLGALDNPDLVEAIAESDDKLLEKYLEGAALSPEELVSGLRQAVIKRKVFPVIAGSASTDKGIPEFLDTVIKYMPSPLEHPQLEGTNPLKPEEKKEVVSREEGPFQAFVFKTISDPYVGQLTLLRVFSGSLIANTNFYNVNKRTKERIGNIFILQGKEQRNVESASCGDIVAIAKLKETVTSDSLSDEKNQILLLHNKAFARRRELEGFRFEFCVYRTDAGLQMKFVAMQRTHDMLAFDPTHRELPALMRTVVLNGAKFSLVLKDGDLLFFHPHEFRRAFWDFLGSNQRLDRFRFQRR